jgi:hypothetical protein
VRMPVDNTPSIMAQGPGESGLALPARLAHPAPGEEHVALLGNPGRFDLLRRKDDLLDDGVAALFGITGGEAELLGLCFHAGTFTPPEAKTWLAQRGLKPLLFVPNSGSNRGL